MGLAFECPHPERVLPSYARYLRRSASEFFELDGVPIRIWFRKRFQLRTDEELQGFLRGHHAGFEEWMKDEDMPEMKAEFP